MYDKLHLLDACDMPWTDAAAKPYSLAGMRNRANADILILLPPSFSPLPLIRKPTELEHVNTVADPRQPTIAPGSSTKPQPASQAPFCRACYRCCASNDFAHVCPCPPRQQMKFQVHEDTRSTTCNHVLGIAELIKVLLTPAPNERICRALTSPTAICTLGKVSLFTGSEPPGVPVFQWGQCRCNS